MKFITWIQSSLMTDWIAKLKRVATRNLEINSENVNAVNVYLFIIQKRGEERFSLSLLSLFSSPTLFKHCSITIIWLKTSKHSLNIVVLHSKRESTNKHKRRSSYVVLHEKSDVSTARVVDSTNNRHSTGVTVFPFICICKLIIQGWYQYL